MKWVSGWIESNFEALIHWSCAVFRIIVTKLTNWLTHWLLFSRLHWCDPGVLRYQLKLVEVAHVGAEKLVDESLVQMWKLKFGHKFNFLFRIWAQGLVKILKMKLRRDCEADVWTVFAADAWLRLWSLILVKILKLGLVKILKFKLKLMFGQDSEDEICKNL